VLVASEERSADSGNQRASQQQHIGVAQRLSQHQQVNFTERLQDGLIQRLRLAEPVGQCQSVVYAEHYGVRSEVPVRQFVASNRQRDEFDVPITVSELVQQVAVAVAVTELDQIIAAA